MSGNGKSQPMATSSSPRPAPRLLRKLVGIGVALIVAWRVSLMLFGTQPTVGLVGGNLRPCPSSPNCVCSQDEDAGHNIAPLPFADSPREAWDRLHDLVVKLPRTRVVSRDERYLHVEFTSLRMRFVDDVEFLLDESASLIHVRSASRVGHSDLGANRKRIEALRQQW